MQKKKKYFSGVRSKLGKIQIFGTQFRMLTERGWVILDTELEVQEELNNLKRSKICRIQN